MDLERICNDVVTVINQNGAEHQNVKARVTRDKIVIPNEHIPISIGDTILRSCQVDW